MKRVYWNADGTVDEIVAENVTIHLEQMYDSGYWMGIYDGDGYCMVNIFSRTGRASVVAQADPEGSWVWDDEDTHAPALGLKGKEAKNGTDAA